MAVIPERQAPAPPAENLAWLLAQASHALTIEMTAALEDLGLSPRGHCVLSTAMTGEFTQTELAHAIGLDKTTMVVAMDDLEAKGLAERRPSKADRRARVIAVTKAGRRRSRRGRSWWSGCRRRCSRGSPRSSASPS